MVRIVDTAVSTAQTLKREDCKHTKHDSAFSDWKILIGPCDWEDYLLNKEGAERYRTHNLPNCSSCPGLYELGIVKEGKFISKLNSKNVIPAYLGQADDVRTRLQQYGRGGAHLENGWSNGEQSDRKVLGLFSDIFSNGFSIAFRWAPMESKKDAEKTESQLLRTFDYAWNRSMNGERRPSDIHKKLSNTVFEHKGVLLGFKKIRVYPPKEVGLRIKHCEPPVLENGSNFYTKQNDTNILINVSKFGRSRPTLVSKDCNMSNNNVGICGVALGHGFICIRPPVEGRKRCVDHKGMKVNALVSPRSDLKHEGMMINEKKVCEEVKHERMMQKVCAVKYEGMMVNEKKSNVTGVDSLTCVAITLNGSCCRRKPSKNSKFCRQHEGMMVNEKKVCEKVKHERMMQKCSEEVNYERMMVNEKKSNITGVDSLTCVAITLNGFCCRRKPSKNSKFCWQHGGMMVNEEKKVCEKVKHERMMQKGWEEVKYGGMMNNKKWSNITGVDSLTCVAITRNGSRCRRKPNKNSMFCWQH